MRGDLATLREASKEISGFRIASGKRKGSLEAIWRLLRERIVRVRWRRRRRRRRRRRACMVSQSLSTLESFCKQTWMILSNGTPIASG